MYYYFTTVCINRRKSLVPVHASGQPDLVSGAGSARPQELHDNHQHTVLGVSDHVFLRRKRGDHVRVLDNDGSERWILGRPVFRVHRRSV